MPKVLEFHCSGAWRALGTATVVDETVVCALSKRGRYLASRFGGILLQPQPNDALELPAATVDGSDDLRLVEDGQEHNATIDVPMGPIDEPTGEPLERETKEIEVPQKSAKKKAATRKKAGDQ